MVLVVLGTSTVQCTSLKTYSEIFYVVSKEFNVTSAPEQTFSGNIESVHYRGAMAAALVCSYEWPISDGYPEITSSADEIEFPKLGI
jgi:hypothetical protein